VHYPKNLGDRVFDDRFITEWFTHRKYNQLRLTFQLCSAGKEYVNSTSESGGHENRRP